MSLLHSLVKIACSAGLSATLIILPGINDLENAVLSIPYFLMDSLIALNPSSAYWNNAPRPKDRVFIIPAPPAVFRIAESTFFNPLPVATERACCPAISPTAPAPKAITAPKATPARPPDATTATARSTPAPAIAPEVAPCIKPAANPLPSRADTVPPISPPTSPPTIHAAKLPWVSLVGSGLFRQYANILVPINPCPVLARLSALINLQISGS